MKKNKELKKILSELNIKKISVDEALVRINKITIKEVKEDDIHEYWSYTTLDELINNLLIIPIINWNSIDDDKAILLIKEILNNIEDDVILERNSEALEKRYKKSSGTIIDWIFQEDITDSNTILHKLKMDDIIQL